MIEAAFDVLSSVLVTCLWAFAGWLVADFGSGVIHWGQDRYGSPRWPVVGGVVRDTIRHHRKPRGFTQMPFWQRSWRVFCLAAVVGAVFTFIGAPIAFIAPLVLAIGLSNEIHVAAHSSPKNNGVLITTLQSTGVIQSQAHHAAHHRHLKNTNYCTVTNWLNPLLERARFWRRIEVYIRVAFHTRPRRDPVVRRLQRRKWRAAVSYNAPTEAMTSRSMPSEIPFDVRLISNGPVPRMASLNDQVPATCSKSSVTWPE